jgi:Flp pilus assembly protein TadG
MATQGWGQGTSERSARLEQHPGASAGTSDHPQAWRRVKASAGRLGKRGTVAVEFAIVVPVLLVILTGIAQFGLTLNQYVMLTNAVATGAQLFSISRGTTSTPYTSTVTAIEGAALTLTPANLTITLSVNGTACTTDSACQTALTNNATNPATVSATYPCSLQIAFYNFWPGCALSSQVTELIQ